MTAFATQSNIDMSGPGLLGSDVAGSSRRMSKRITIGTGLTLSGGVLSNSLDLSGYVQKTSSTGSLILPSGTTAERDWSPAAGYSRWNTTTSRFERWTGSVWENYVCLSGDTMTGSLAITQASANASVIASTGYSLTGSNAQSLVDLAGTWNTSGTPSALKIDVTNTASNAASLLLDIRRSGKKKLSLSAAASARLSIFTEYAGSTYEVWAVDCGGASGFNSFMSSYGGWAENTSLAPSGYGYLSSVASSSYRQWSQSVAAAGLVKYNQGTTIEWYPADYRADITASDLIIRRGGAGTLTQRNGINAQCFLLNKSYTSDATQEALMLDAGKQISGKLGLYSYRGSIGGSNYPIQIGMLAADGSTFSGMSVATSGTVSVDALYLMGGSPSQVGTANRLTFSSGAAYIFYRGNTGNSFTVDPASGGTAEFGGPITCTNLTASGIVSVSASTTARASINLPSGTAPTSPANGDIWSDGSDIKVRLGGVTYTLSKV